MEQTRPQSSKISIILPVHNGQKYLNSAIKSCTSQTYANWELIAVDDASTDSSPEILANWAARDPRIRVHRSTQNLRLPGALNAGFKLAQGAYWTWTSDDNLFRPRALETMARHLESHPEIDMVYCDYDWIDESGKALKQHGVLPAQRLWEGNCVGACFLYRREMGLCLGAYAQDLFLAEDYDYWLRAAARFNIQPLHESLYEYRFHSGSLSETRKNEIARAAEQALSRNLDGLFAIHARTGAEAALSLAKKAAERHEWGAAFRRVLASARRAPVWTVFSLIRKASSFLKKTKS